MLIIALLLVFAWSTAYYENALKNASIQYNKNIEEIQRVTGNLALEDINESVNLKDTFQKDKEEFEKRYYEIKAENEGLMKEKDKLEEEMNSVKSELEDYKAKFSILERRFREIQNSLVEANEQLSKLISKNRELCSKAKASNPQEDC